MNSRIDLKQAADRLRAGNHILILTHRRPDGDTVGSAAALCRILRALDKDAWVFANEDLTPKLAFLLEGLTAPAGYLYDTLVAVDIADTQLLPPASMQFAEKIDLCLDHHPSNRDYARETVLHGTAAATGEIIWLLAQELGVQPDLPVWEALYIAVATDTGCFRFSNTTPLAHRIAADAIAAGLDFLPHNRAFFEVKSRVRFLIERKMFDDMIFSADGRVCCSWLDRDWLDSVNATDDDLDNLSTLTMSLEGVDCGIILTQNKQDPAYKASVRTHRPADASRICQNFGGGGHPRAAGCTVSLSAQQACTALMAAAAEELARW